MHSLLSTMTSTLKTNLQAKLINTLFALTLATYYISSPYSPILYRWNFKNKICEVLSELKIENHSEALSTEIRGALYKHNLLSSSMSEPLLTFPFPSLQLRKYNDFIRKELKINNHSNIVLSPLFLEIPLLLHKQNLFPSPNTPPTPGSISTVQINQQESFQFKESEQVTPDLVVPFKNKLSSFFALPSDSTNIETPTTAFQALEEVNELNRALCLSDNILPPLFSEIPSVPSKALLTSPSFEPLTPSSFKVSQTTSQTPIHVKKSEHIVPDSSQPLKNHFPPSPLTQPISKNAESLSEEKHKYVNISQYFKPIQKANFSPNPDDLRKNQLQPWHTYKVNSRDPLLRLWLMMVAPEGKVPEAEIPYREALIKTILSPEFQPYITRSWEIDNSPEMRKRRVAFFYAYMKNVDWSKTPFGFLFPTEEEDWHNVDFPTFLAGYKFPLKLGRLKLGICTYKDEDFSHENLH